MKYINELTDNEKRALIEKNTALQNMVYDDMIDNEIDFISEQLDYIRGACRDYNIAAYGRNYIFVSDALKFLDGLEELQKIYCTLPDNMQLEIDRVLKARDRFRAIDMNYNNLYNLSVWLDQKAQRFADCIAEYFSNCLDFGHLDMVSYFIEFYADERMDESYFINDDGILCQTITKQIA